MPTLREFVRLINWKVFKSQMRFNELDEEQMAQSGASSAQGFKQPSCNENAAKKRKNDGQASMALP